MISKEHLQGAKSAIKSTIHYLESNPNVTREDIITFHRNLLITFDVGVTVAIKEILNGYTH